MSTHKDQKELTKVSAVAYHSHQSQRRLTSCIIQNTAAYSSLDREYDKRWLLLRNTIAYESLQQLCHSLTLT